MGFFKKTNSEEFHFDALDVSTPITKKEIRRLLYIAWNARDEPEERMSSKVQVKIREAMIFDPYMSEDNQDRKQEEMNIFYMKWYRSGQPPTRAVVDQFMRLIRPSKRGWFW